MNRLDHDAMNITFWGTARNDGNQPEMPAKTSRNQGQHGPVLWRLLSLSVTISSHSWRTNVRKRGVAD
jgi:hypothetical protein